MKRWCPLVIVLAVGCQVSDDLPGKPDPKDRFVNPTEVKDFATLYAKNCAGCHGKDGKRGPAPPLNDEIFLTIVSDTELTKVIAAGRANTEMPAFAKSQGGTLSDEQVKILAAGLRSTWGATKAKGDWPPYVAAGKGDAARGQKVFAKACAACHGEDGTEKIPIRDAAFLALSSEQSLRRFVITGRGDLKSKMPNCLENAPEIGRPMSAADVDDVVALLMSWK